MFYRIKMHTKMNISPPKIFNPVIFWDTINIDLDKNSEYIISRVLDYGDHNDLKKIREVYSDKQIIKTVKKRRGLLLKTALFWSVYFNIPQEEIACLKGYYQSGQLK